MELVKGICLKGWNIMKYIIFILKRKAKSTSRTKKAVLTCILVPFFLCAHYYNFMAYMAAYSFHNFQYPLDVDLPKVVEDVMNNQDPGVKPINPHNYPVVLENDRKCKTEDGDDLDIFIVFIIKSALENFALRNVIRKTWANEFAVPSVMIRRIFVVGTRREQLDLQQKLGLESKQHEDILQEYFHDHYYNNTIKLMAGFRWATTYCRGASYFVFMDDDYYVSTRNLVKFLTPIPQAKQENLLVGYIWTNAMPFRSTYSKWYISLTEYPYRYWPPYPTAGSFIVSGDLAKKIFIASHYTQYLRFDDAFVGILLYKLNIKPYHNKNIYFYSLPYDKEKYKSVVAVHGFKDPEEINKIYIEQERIYRSQTIL